MYEYYLQCQKKVMENPFLNISNKQKKKKKKKKKNKRKKGVYIRTFFKF